jgi:hypothetical protein
VQVPGFWQVRSLRTPDWDPDSPARSGLVPWHPNDLPAVGDQEEFYATLTNDEIDNLVFGGCEKQPLP